MKIISYKLISSLSSEMVLLVSRRNFVRHVVHKCFSGIGRTKFRNGHMKFCNIWSTNFSGRGEIRWCSRKCCVNLVSWWQSQSMHLFSRHENECLNQAKQWHILMWSLHTTHVFLQNTQNRHPIAGPRIYGVFMFNKDWVVRMHFYGLLDYLLAKLQHFQNVAARILRGIGKYDKQIKYDLPYCVTCPRQNEYGFRVVGSRISMNTGSGDTVFGKTYLICIIAQVLKIVLTQPMRSCWHCQRYVVRSSWKCRTVIRSTAPHPLLQQPLLLVHSMVLTAEKGLKFKKFCWGFHLHSPATTYCKYTVVGKYCTFYNCWMMPPRKPALFTSDCELSWASS